jgi:hypothetical protein
MKGRNMKKKRVLLGIIFCLILVSNVVLVSAKYNGDPNLSIKIIPNKEKFPRLYKEGANINATIIVTNKGPESFENFIIIIWMYQSFPDPRVPNEREISESIKSLESGESFKVNFEWNPSIQGYIPIGLFPLCVSIKKDNSRVKFGGENFIVIRFNLFG